MCLMFAFYIKFVRFLNIVCSVILLKNCLGNF